MLLLFSGEMYYQKQFCKVTKTTMKFNEKLGRIHWITLKDIS